MKTLSKFYAESPWQKGFYKGDEAKCATKWSCKMNKCMLWWWPWYHIAKKRIAYANGSKVVSEEALTGISLTVDAVTVIPAMACLSHYQLVSLFSNNLPNFGINRYMIKIYLIFLVRLLDLPMFTGCCRIFKWDILPQEFHILDICGA